MTRYELAEEKRQAALDYINANPGANAPQIIAAMKAIYRTDGGITDRLREMTLAGELQREKVVSRVKRADGFGTNLITYVYTALVEKTRAASEIRAQATDKLKTSHANNRKQRAKLVKSHRDENRRPIPNQGGQGNLRHEIRRGCSLS